ncbi:helix-turn-helix domain-containing protein [Methylobacter sp.]|uniref:helix-turn-helix transcriptional regulator n=1 Tax=Methylobacter sp. TaxID=2051955 RepID=UPI002487707A|nr:helix-turn-helix domain-containing protein [Methylobacter sp.]MDI1277297.1 helix-turn-helix domain-containing protein [Methylobacter sp.]MDI1357863.1 helix-turn-helix domain-containing protein [Methylobacter sp.]
MPNTTKSVLSSSALTEAQLAERWNISRKTLQAWRLKGGGPEYVKIGSAIRYMMRAVNQYESVNTHDSTSSSAA